jgi:hypothetical protein
MSGDPEESHRIMGGDIIPQHCNKIKNSGLCFPDSPGGQKYISGVNISVGD